MKKHRIIICVIGILFIGPFIACSGDSSEDPVIETKNPPAKSVGVIPADGEPCSNYQSISSEELKVSVDFEWSPAQYAERYILTISEGGNEVVRNTYTTLEASIPLDRGKTYTWVVISVNKDGEAVGNTYSFTTPGVQVGNYAPYPAEISVDFNEDNLFMTVSWTGSDEDEDVLHYDVRVFLGETLLYESLGLSETSLEPLTFNPFVEYVVEVISWDDFGNSSIARLKVGSY